MNVPEHGPGTHDCARHTHGADAAHGADDTHDGRDPFEGRHPKDRVIEDEDPMLLTAEPVAGDPEVMLVCLVEEYASQGLPREHILQLFDTPFFQATWGLRQLFGAEGVRERVDAVLGRRRVLRFRTSYPAAAPDNCSHLEVPDILHCAPPDSHTQEHHDA